MKKPDSSILVMFHERDVDTFFPRFMQSPKKMRLKLKCYSEFGLYNDPRVNKWNIVHVLSGMRFMPLFPDEASAANAVMDIAGLRNDWAIPTAEEWAALIPILDAICKKHGAVHPENVIITNTVHESYSADVNEPKDDI